MFGITLGIVLGLVIIGGGYIFSWAHDEPHVTKITTPVGIVALLFFTLLESYTIVSAGHVGVQIKIGRAHV